MKKFACAALLTTLFFSCKKEINDTDQSAALDEMTGTNSIAGRKVNPREGFVYTMSNEAGGNSILVYRQAPNGRLTYQSATASGGAGNGTGLGSQYSIVIDASHQWLYAVNAGSNSVSSFSIVSDGGLTLAHTVSSNGTFPVSITVWGNWLYVVNSTTANISGYTIGAGGNLTPLAGSVQALSATNALPAQISFVPGGQKLLVTEKAANKLTTFSVNGSGIAGPGSSVASAGKTPFGFDFSGNYAVVAEAGTTPGSSSVSSYSVSGSTSTVTGPVANGQSATCWTEVTSNGKYAYVTNTQSNNISFYTVGSGGNLQLIDAAEAATGAIPIDVTLSGNEDFLYNLNSGSHSISQFKRNNHNASLKSIGDVTGLPAHAVGLAAF